MARDTESARGGLRSILRALGHRNFRHFFLGQGVSLIGTWMQQLALVWLVYQLTNSPALLAAVAMDSESEQHSRRPRMFEHVHAALRRMQSERGIHERIASGHETQRATGRSSLSPVIPSQRRTTDYRFSYFLSGWLVLTRRVKVTWPGSARCTRST